MAEERSDLFQVRLTPKSRRHLKEIEEITGTTNWTQIINSLIDVGADVIKAHHNNIRVIQEDSAGNRTEVRYIGL